jgi:hypothetical protein
VLDERIRFFERDLNGRKSCRSAETGCCCSTCGRGPSRERIIKRFRLVEQAEEMDWARPAWP